MKIAIWAIAAAVLALVAATVWLGTAVREETVVKDPYREGLKLVAGAKPPAAAGEPAEVAGCALAAGPCAGTLPGGGAVTLDLGPRPLRTMADLNVRVELAPGTPEPSEVSVWVSMRGMAMGQNRARLARTAAGRWEGKGVLVRCPSGRRDWLADVEVASGGAAPRTARFPLTVAE